MDGRTRMRVEIDAIHELLPELSYYSVLQLDQSCDADSIGNAFRKESRRLHPDRMATLRDEELSGRANAIYTLVNEAYRCLKDPEQRAQYDQLLATGALRMTDEAAAGAQADKRSSDPEFAASHPKAETYWKLALRDWKDNSFKACVMNIKFALNFEPDNDTFKEWLAKALDAQKEADSKKEKNPYKLRIM